MKSLITLSALEKSYGAKTLFQSLSLSFYQKEKVAIIGKNGSGKSTLLKVLAGHVEADGGDVIRQRNLRISYVPQSPTYVPEKTVIEILEEATKDVAGDEDEKSVSRMMSLSLCGFEDFEQKVGELSGGWIKRLSMACAMSQDPELLLLDEPTNHMDWTGIRWLEEFLNNWEGAFVLISHDRTFLNNTTNRTVEIGGAFLNEHLSFNLPFDAYLDRRATYFEEQQKLSESLGNKARRELEWLRAGVKARTTKSSARIKDAHDLFDNLNQVQNRIKQSKQKVSLQLDESGRRSKKLLELEGVGKAYADKKLFSGLDFKVSPKTRLALLGDNGSGKSTLVKIIMGEIEPDTGKVALADQLKRVYFDQSKSKLNLEESVFDFLGEGSDHVQFRGESLHVASYASKFLFTSDHYFLKIAQLSGGERARLQLAKIFLESCDILILDEPTNDLDIDSIEVLEDTLASLKTALVLISHDRKFINNVCTQFLALEGGGDWSTYADLDQWLSPSKKGKASNNDKEVSLEVKPKKTKMSYNDKKELEGIEAEILKKEEKLEKLNESISKEGLELEKINKISTQIAELQVDIQARYERWQELESLSASS